VRSLDIAVVGAGTAGSAAAIYLARAGHAVTVFERVPEPGPVGAGIVMQPSGLGVLADLGLHERVVARGAPLERLRCVTAGGRALLDLRYADVGARCGLGLHRGVLFAELQRAVAAARVPVVCGCGVTALRPSGDRVVLVDDGGRARGRFDLCVVADGARSRLRDETDPPLDERRARVYPWGALWFVGRDRTRRWSRELYQVVDGARRMLGILPTGVGPRGDEPLVSLFWSVRADRVDAWRAAGLDAWRREILRYAPAAADLVDQIRDPDDVTFSAYHDVLLRPWHTRNTVYLGDAAHATSPQLGQGCNLALADAHALAAALAAHERLPAALADYSRRRRRHLAFYQRATRWLTPFFQSDSRLLGALRDVAMPLGARLPWLRRQMVWTMCGLKLSPWSALPLPAVSRADVIS
jgi:2-polyprenyl-6-methoxyphenol hydroxylase-like FAD-dependent oxidoreductase